MDEQSNIATVEISENSTQTNRVKDISQQVNQIMYVTDVKDVEQPQQPPATNRIVQTIERNACTVNPIPHSYLGCFKTGGYLGNNVLLWGNITKHHYFPFIALVGPDWHVMLLTYTFFIILICMNALFILKTFNRLDFLLIVLFIELILFWCLLTTTLSDPGIIRRGEPPSFKEPVVSKCVICEVGRPKRAIHCDRCNTCYLKLDHHCPWMGKCIAKNNYYLFYISVMSIFGMIMLSGFVVIIADILNIRLLLVC